VLFAVGGDTVQVHCGVATEAKVKSIGAEETRARLGENGSSVVTSIWGVPVSPIREDA